MPILTMTFYVKMSELFSMTLEAFHTSYEQIHKAAVVVREKC